MPNVSMKALLEAGVHFGHRTRRWHPKMKRYIFTERNNIHIIDLQQTLKALAEVYDLIRDTVARGGVILFVGTKRQAKEGLSNAAERCGMPYVNQRWLGGTLTNFVTIRSRIEVMKRLEGRQERGDLALLPKKEALSLTRELNRLHRRFDGLRTLERLPDLVFVVDVNREDIAVREANRVEIPVVAMVDTNCDPDLIDHVIPANDDAIRAINLISSLIADAAIEGRQVLEAAEAAEAAEVEQVEAEFLTEDEEAVEPVFVSELEFEEEAEEIDLDLEPAEESELEEGLAAVEEPEAALETEEPEDAVEAATEEDAEAAVAVSGETVETATEEAPTATDIPDEVPVAEAEMAGAEASEAPAETDTA